MSQQTEKQQNRSYNLESEIRIIHLEERGEEEKIMRENLSDMETQYYLLGFLEEAMERM